MAHAAQNLHDSDLLEHPDQVSLRFMLGMLITYLVSWGLLAIPLLVISLIQRVKDNKKSVAIK
jgi:hypothetical protein